MTHGTDQQTFTRWMKGLTRSVTTALLVSAIGAGAAEAQQVITVRVGDGTTTAVAPGGQISIPIVVDMSAAAGLDLASITFDLNWTPGLLSFVSASPGSFGNVLFNTSQTGSGKLTTSMFDVTGTTTSFILATVVFDATAAVPAEGQFAPITISVTAAGNGAGSNILGNVVGVDLLVCIGTGGGLRGDVNDDGAVNIIDAQQIARYSVGLPPPPDPGLVVSRGDATEDGDVNIIDAQQIARFSVGLSTPAAPNIGVELGGGCGDSITGDWSGTIFQAPTTFVLDFSLTEASDGSVTGSGTIDAFDFTIVGSRTGSDVILTMTVPDFIPFIFRGTFDGNNTMTGVTNESGFMNAPTTYTRTGAPPPPPDLVIVLPPSSSALGSSGRDFASYRIDQRRQTGGSDPSVVAGGPYTLPAWIVRNQGGQPSGDFSNGFYLSTDETITSSDIFLDGTNNLSLDAGEEFSWSAPTVTIPAETADGIYYVGILVDNAGAVAESDEDNNWLSRQITVGIDPLGITGQWQGTIFQAPTTFMVDFLLTEAADGSVTGSGTIDAFPAMTIVGSRTGSDVILTMTVPDFTPFIFTGTWDLANAMTGVTNGSGFLDAPTAYTRATTGVGPDLTILIPPSSSALNSSDRDIASYRIDQRDQIGASQPSVVAGGPYTLPAWIVRNQGNEASGDFSNGFYLSTDETITSSDIFLDGTNNLSLDADTEFPWSAPTVTIPAGTADGSYFVGILVDNTGVVAETNEANNWFSLPIEVGPDALCPSGGVSEVEPNDAWPQSRFVGIPGVACGEVNPSGDGDYWSFSVAAGTTLAIDVDAWDDGSPLDPILELFDTDGVTTLAFNDDSGGSLDSFIQFTFAAGGTYFVKISGFSGSGGTGQFYTIQFDEVTPGVGITGQWDGVITDGVTTSLLDISLVEASGGSVTGIGVINALTISSIVGFRTGSIVTLTMTVEGFIPFVFDGTWDLVNTMTGITHESGFLDVPTTFTRGRTGRRRVMAPTSPEERGRKAVPGSRPFNR